MDIQKAIEWQEKFKKSYENMPIAKPKVDEVCNFTIEALKELQRYTHLGTFTDFFVALKWREKLDPVFNEKTNIYYCPNCGREIQRGYSLYCSGCGQGINWKKGNLQTLSFVVCDNVNMVTLSGGDSLVKYLEENCGFPNLKKVEEKDIVSTAIIFLESVRRSRLRISWDKAETKSLEAFIGDSKIIAQIIF